MLLTSRKPTKIHSHFLFKKQRPNLNPLEHSFLLIKIPQVFLQIQKVENHTHKNRENSMFQSCYTIPKLPWLKTFWCEPKASLF